MACSSDIEGMTIDTSCPPLKCESCIFSKQIWSSVLKVREGPRAVKHLECIYIDLCGSMPIPSHSSHLYSMNIIDNYFSFVWSFPLHLKNEDASMLKAWLLALEVQTNYYPQSYVTDNRELCLSQIWDWCFQKGILYLFTAPYMSAHNR